MLKEKTGVEVSFLLYFVNLTQIQRNKEDLWMFLFLSLEFSHFVFFSIFHASFFFTILVSSRSAPNTPRVAKLTAAGQVLPPPPPPPTSTAAAAAAVAVSTSNSGSLGRRRRNSASLAAAAGVDGVVETLIDGSGGAGGEASSNTVAAGSDATANAPDAAGVASTAAAVAPEDADGSTLLTCACTIAVSQKQHNQYSPASRRKEFIMRWESEVEMLIFIWERGGGYKTESQRGSLSTDGRRLIGMWWQKTKDDFNECCTSYSFI